MTADKRCPRCGDSWPRTPQFWRMRDGHITTGFCIACSCAYSRDFTRRQRGNSASAALRAGEIEAYLFERERRLATLEAPIVCACGATLRLGYDGDGRTVDYCPHCHEARATRRRRGLPLPGDEKLPPTDYADALACA